MARRPFVFAPHAWLNILVNFIAFRMFAGVLRYTAGGAALAQGV